VIVQGKIPSGTPLEHEGYISASAAQDFSCVKKNQDANFLTFFLGVFLLAPCLVSYVAARDARFGPLLTFGSEHVT
jgi:hypothetical protein